MQPNPLLWYSWLETQLWVVKPKQQPMQPQSTQPVVQEQQESFWFTVPKNNKVPEKFDVLWMLEKTKQDAIAMSTKTNQKTLELQQKYAASKDELIDIGKKWKEWLISQWQEIPEWADELDIADYVIQGDEKMMDKFARKWVMWSIKGAIIEWWERQQQAQVREDTGQQSGIETAWQQLSAWVWVLSDVVWDAVWKVVWTAWDLWKSAWLSFWNLIRPLVWKDMMTDEEKTQRASELSDRAKQQWGNVIAPILQEYNKMDARTKANFDSLLPYLDLWVWVPWASALWKATKPLTQEVAWEAVKIVKWAMPKQVKIPEWFSKLSDYAINQASWLSKKTREVAYRDPDLLDSIQRWEYTKEALLDEVDKAIKTKWSEFSEMGSIYNKVRKQDVDIDVAEAKEWIKSILGKSLVRITDKWLDFTDSAIANSNSKKAVTQAYNSIVNRWVVKPEVLLNIRKQLDDLIDYWSDVSTQWQALVKEMRKEIDTIAKEKIPWLKELDAEYAPIRQEISKIKKDYFNKDWTLKDNALSKVSNIANESNLERLKRIERFLPDIRKKAEALRAYDDIVKASENKVWLYVRWGLWASAVVSLNPVLLAGAIATSPDAVIRAIKKASKVWDWVNWILWKVKKWEELSELEIKKIAPEIDKVIKENKWSKEVKELSTAIKLLKEWPLESTPVRTSVTKKSRTLWPWATQQTKKPKLETSLAK